MIAAPVPLQDRGRTLSDMPEAIVVALIAGSVVIVAALAGLFGAVVGSRIAARATREAAATSRGIAEADRRDARRARFADAIRDLTIEALEAADDDVARGVYNQWALRDRPTAEILPRRIPESIACSVGCGCSLSSQR